MGHALARGSPQPVGFDVGQIVADGRGLVTWLANEAGALLGADVALTENDAHLDLSQLGDGYGAFTEAGIEAIGLLARTEGIVLDPVYSAKGMAGLIADAGAGRIDGPVVFWHTGGGPSLFASEGAAGKTQLRQQPARELALKGQVVHRHHRSGTRTLGVVKVGGRQSGLARCRG